jgi:hypothetical protein
MFDFERWAAWASEQATALREQGREASFTFTEESRATPKPAFFVDFDTHRNSGRIIVRSTGEFDFCVHLNLSVEQEEIRDLPAEATDQNFEVLFLRFINMIKS